MLRRRVGRHLFLDGRVDDLLKGRGVPRVSDAVDSTHGKAPSGGYWSWPATPSLWPSTSDKTIRSRSRRHFCYRRKIVRFLNFEEKLKNYSNPYKFYA